MGGSASKTSPHTAHGAAPRRLRQEVVKRPGLFDSRLEQPVVGSLSLPGFGKDDDENEDCVLTGELSCGVHYCAVFDGHGDEGLAIREACRREFPKLLQSRWPSDSVVDLDLVEFLRALFVELHTTLVALEGGVAQYSGAAGTVALYNPETAELVVGNVGDTKAVLGRGAGEAGELLTVDHYCTVDEEKARIVAAGGTVDAKEDVQLGTLGEIRVWKGQRCLETVSRSVGDAEGMTVGMLHSPSIRTVNLRSNDLFLVICSGGIWKVVDVMESVQSVADDAPNLIDASAAASMLCEKATARLAELWQGENTSALVLLFRTPQ